MHRSRKRLVQRNLREGPRDRKAARGGSPRPHAAADCATRRSRRGYSANAPIGPVVGYLATQSGTGTKTDTPILTTPQSISVVTKDQIADQGAQNLIEALRYTPGVTLDTLRRHHAFFDAFKLRGFDAPRYLDGLRLPADPGTIRRSADRDLWSGTIEVLKGPSASLYGQSDPGGLINMVSKRPTLTPQYEIDRHFWFFRALSGRIRYRRARSTRTASFSIASSALADSTDGQTDFVQDNKLFIAPSFTWRPTKDTTFTILSQYQNSKTRDVSNMFRDAAGLAAQSLRTYSL